MPSHAYFEINIISALSSQLVAAFSNLDIGPLAGDEVSSLPKGQGVYKLYHQSSLVYVGKASSVKARLDEHRYKISGRQNIEITDIGFKCLFVHPNWTALAPESSLIDHYRTVGEGECAWNGNGFGPHDPGRERETTNKAPDGFDAFYPIRQDWACDWIEAGDWKIPELLQAIKSKLPYLLRYETAKQKSREPHADYKDLTITVPEFNMPLRDLLHIIAGSIPGWQATAFPSHVILYKEHRTYSHGQVLWPV